MNMPSVAKMGALLGAGCLIASLFNLATGKKAYASYPNPCERYLQKAHLEMKNAESIGLQRNLSDREAKNAVLSSSISAMYSSYYVACEKASRRFYNPIQHDKYFRP